MLSLNFGSTLIGMLVICVATSKIILPENSSDIALQNNLEISETQDENIVQNISSRVPRCGGLLTNDSGTIKSPLMESLGGKKYFPLLNCVWIIRLPEEDIIKITFTKFELESSRSCEWDYLEVFDGEGTQSDLVGRFCGNDSPPKLVSSSNVMTVLFKTDMSLQYEGFSLNYETARIEEEEEEFSH